MAVTYAPAVARCNVSQNTEALSSYVWDCCCNVILVVWKAFFHLQLQLVRACLNPLWSSGILTVCRLMTVAPDENKMWAPCLILMCYCFWVVHCFLRQQVLWMLCSMWRKRFSTADVLGFSWCFSNIGAFNCPLHLEVWFHTTGCTTFTIQAWSLVIFVPCKPSFRFNDICHDPIHCWFLINLQIIITS